MTADQGRRPIRLFGRGKLFRLESLIKTQTANPLWAAKAPSPKAWKTGAGEGIRTLDPNLGKIRLYEISVLNQLFIKLVKNPNTIRTFSAQFAQKDLCSMFYRPFCAQFRSFEVLPEPANSRI